MVRYLIVSHLFKSKSHSFVVISREYTFEECSKFNLCIAIIQVTEIYSLTSEYHKIKMGIGYPKI